MSEVQISDVACISQQSVVQQILPEFGQAHMIHGRPAGKHLQWGPNLKLAQEVIHSRYHPPLPMLQWPSNDLPCTPYVHLSGSQVSPADDAHLHKAKLSLQSNFVWVMQDLKKWRLRLTKEFAFQTCNHRVQKWWWICCSATRIWWFLIVSNYNWEYQ